MSEGKASIDLETAKLDPAAVFRDPEEVVTRADLSRQEKIEILRRWAYDAREIAVAVEENMRPQRNSDLLDRVLAALNELGAEAEPEPAPPTKQGGI